MKRLERTKMLFVFVLFYLLLFLPSGAFSQAIIIDHNSTDLSQIPDTWIDQVKTMKVHYAHTSHGEQITVGLERIETSNSKYSVAIEYSTLPTESGALCIFDGQPGETYIEPYLYWDSPEGIADTNSVLSGNPGITVSMWMWCQQQEWNSSDDTQRYLDAMATLEAANPGVTFIYATGNAQAKWGDGYNRYLRNKQVRDYCNANNKVLFDFADIDCWYNGDQNTYQHSGTAVPVEHSQYGGPEEAGHTTYESCEQKGKAFWWMMARVAGWDPGASGTTTVGSSTTTTAGTDTTTTTTTEEGGVCSSEAIYGEYSKETVLLRYLRDNVLSTTPEGREIVRLYYKLSPAIAGAMAEDEEFKEAVKGIIDEVLELIEEEAE